MITDKSFVTGVRKGSQKVYERTREDARYREGACEDPSQGRAGRGRRRAARERQLYEEELENEKILRMDKKVSGVMMDTSLARDEKEEKTRDDMHEINLKSVSDHGQRETAEEEEIEKLPSGASDSAASSYDQEEDGSDAMMEITGEDFVQDEEMPYPEETTSYQEDTVSYPEEPVYESPCSCTGKAGTASQKRIRVKPVAALKKDPGAVRSSSGAVGTVVTGEMYQKLHEKKSVEKEYHFPPIDLLRKGKAKSVDSSRELRETAERLRQTLQTFGVKVTITDISQGPAVTRYELQPEQGVKVSKIVGLSDDIKLNLAATDIRIEAPIPGKAAIGIEVPNRENTAVALRDLLDTKEFKEFDSRLAFAVGKDIAGKTVVTDIAKMPHMLIAGATGSGKSVCINTLIMSILYKAKPDEVKLIMVDPKVVELSVYNGIPHLLIPVVTDPKKAAAALHWGVAEMTDRYQRFADFNVRDLKGYNKKLEEMQARGETEIPAKMPQIVIIVDELADLMMVAPGEVEESICRLAQLARAAGIHLIIATQRPSVDVITGLIKANMPSRIAFSVSSGVDSRTILDMNGAEKLLGKGDMLFYPQGYTKPARVQGAFVSDKEVSDVVEYLKNQRLGNVYSSDIEEKIADMGAASAGGSADTTSDKDEYFVEAGKFIIEKDKASIGMLQRMFKIGFNRAARIMDQLSEAGVVGEEEGTKPRKVLMSMEQFEQYIEEQL
ncbi:MAG: DNA translocase FtsK [Lachnospiraceae bacterium]